MSTTPYSAVAAFVITVLGAPAIPGIASRTKAVMTGRRGSPVWQLYTDLRKLARRGAVYSTTTTLVFRLAPLVVVAATVIAAAIVPLDGRNAMIQFSGDAIAFAYLLALGRFAMVLAALDTGSSFEGMGASREVTFAALAEPGLFVALAALGIIARNSSLTVMLGGTALRTASVAAGPSLVMVAMSVFALTLAECARIPVDDPTTHLELTMVHEVMVLDHSGPDLAMMLYANALKLALFSAIIADVLIAAPRAAGWLGALMGSAALLASFVAVGVGIGLVESVMARLRLSKVPLYVAGGALALFGLILVLR